MPSSPPEYRWMRRALTVAGRARAHPNPNVGAVIVRDGAIVGEGWTRGVGQHAEAMALEQAGAAARGATLYVTLEPCSHWQRIDGSARYPCAQRCVDAGIGRVVCALEDPDPQVAGRGFALLHQGGVVVELGLLRDAASEHHRAYLKHRTTGLPYVLHKAALTLDGKIAAPGGDSRWVTGPTARASVHRLRHASDAVIVGAGTVRRDDPSLTTRLPRGRGHDPVPVIFDSQLRLSPTVNVARPGAVLFAVAGDPTPWEATGAEVVFVPADATGRVDCRAALRVLAERGLLSVLLESGGALAAAFHAAELVDRVVFFYAPKLIGGADSPTAIDGAGLATRMAEAVPLTNLRVRRYGEDVAMQGDIYVYRDR